MEQLRIFQTRQSATLRSFGVHTHFAQEHIMSSLKLALLWVSAAVLVIGLGLFATASADRHTATRSPAMSPASAPAAQPQAPSSTTQDVQCLADTAEQPLSLKAPAAAACPSGTAFTCCSCGGCGCRPQRISPANWCGC
jgi:hypothetical protein